MPQSDSTNAGTGTKPKPVKPVKPSLAPSPAGPANLAPAPPVNGGGGGGGGVGSNAYGQVSSKPPQQSISQFLGGDTTYQGQLSAFQKALKDYQAQQNTQKTQYLGQYGLDAKNLGQSRVSAEGDLTDDYSARGLATSGLYGKAYSDLESQYDQRQTSLDQARDSFLNDLTAAYNNYRSTQTSDITKAKQDAIARRASGLGV